MTPNIEAIDYGGRSSKSSRVPGTARLAGARQGKSANTVAALVTATFSQPSVPQQPASKFQLSQ